MTACGASKHCSGTFSIECFQVCLEINESELHMVSVVGYGAVTEKKENGLNKGNWGGGGW
jgi:hypothetical protein